MATWKSFESWRSVTFPQESTLSVPILKCVLATGEPGGHFQCFEGCLRRDGPSGSMGSLLVVVTDEPVDLVLELR